MWAASLLAACGSPAPTVVPTIARPGSPTPAATATPPPTPTATPVPLAALVNDEPIWLADYQVEVERCRIGRAQAGADAGDCPDLALQSLIEGRKLEQAARLAGLEVSDEQLAVELERAAAQAGGADAFAAWLSANLYTEGAYRDALRRDLLQARMKARIASEVSETAEHVHAQMLLVADEALAESLRAQLAAGADFATLALDHSLDLASRAAGGDLGWFASGTLTVPEVEEAAFALQPGETSAVVRSQLGYHLVRTLERDMRVLNPEARRTLQARAYRAWLARALAEADVQTFVAP